MGSKLEVEIELKSPAEEVWSSIKEFATLFPKALPHIYEKIDVVEGDGKSVGSIFSVKYNPESGFASTRRERIEIMDQEKKTLSYTPIDGDGDLLKDYMNFKGIIYVTSKNEGALVKYSIHYDKANAHVPDPDFFRPYVLKLFQGLDAYLLNL